MSHPKIKITYFDMTGRAEAIRLALTVAGIPFEDERISREELAQRKLTGVLPFNQLPVIEIDGEVHAQSLAMLVYAGKLAGLYPDCAKTMLVIHEIMAAFEDMWSKIAPTFAIQDQDAKLAARKKLSENEIPFFLGKIDAIIARAGKNGWAVGDKMTIADLFLYTMAGFLVSGFLDGVPNTILDAHTHIKASMNSVKANDKVAAWEAAHKK